MSSTTTNSSPFPSGKHGGKARERREVCGQTIRQLEWLLLTGPGECSQYRSAIRALKLDIANHTTDQPELPFDGGT